MNQTIKKSLLKSVLILWLLSLTFFSFGQFNPSQLSGLKLWLRSDSAVTINSNKVSQWNDCSGNNYHVTQSSSSNRPSYLLNVQNGYPAVWFDGAASFMNGGTIANLDTSSATVFIVASGDAVTTADVFRGLFAINNHQFCISWETHPSYQNISFSNSGAYTSPPGQHLPATGFPVKVLGIRKKKNVVLEHVINNLVTYSTTGAGFTKNFTNNNYEIGRSSGSWGGYFKGNIFEILVYNAFLPDSSATKVYQYLAQKYGGSGVNLGPDVNKTDFCPHTINAGNAYSEYLWSTGATSSSITISQGGSYYVRVKSIFGIFSYDTIKINYPTLTLTDTLFCSRDTLNLSTPLDGSYSYLWSNGQTTPVAKIINPGQYWVTVSKNGCPKVSNTITVTEDNFPVIAGLGNDTTFCSGNNIELLQPFPLPQGLTYLWSTGATTPTLQISSSGTYQVTVTNQNGCVKKDTIMVIVAGIAPNINFSNSLACSGDTVFFNNLSVPLGDSWSWSFGDGDSSVLENPWHVFSSGGTFPVTLKVTSGICSNSLTKNITIYQSPVTYFVTSQACIGNPYLFLQQCTVTSGDSVVSYNWAFGDFSPNSDLSDPIHTYSQPGTYNVSLDIVTANGCISQYNSTIQVVSSAPFPQGFTYVSPQANSYLFTNKVPFEWNNSPGASKYALEYSPDNFTLSKVRMYPLQNTDTLVSINTTGVVFWRVIAYNLCGDSTVSGVASFNIFQPNHLSGLRLWLRSDSAVVVNSNKVSQWNDCSGNSMNTAQNNSNNQPTFSLNQLNGYPAVKFNGNTSFLTGGIINGLDTTSASVYVLASGEPATGDIFRGFFAIGNHQFWLSWETWLQGLSFSGGGIYTWASAGSLPATGFQPKIISVKKQKNVKVEQIYNNITSYTTTGTAFTGSFTNSFFEIGRSSGSWSGYHKGSIYEVLVYDNYLQDTMSTLIFKYFNSKYAPPVNLGRDIEINYGMCNVTLDAGSRFTNYYWSTGDTTQTIDVSQSGDYSVTVTNIFGEISSDTVHVSLPDFSIADTVFCAGDTIKIYQTAGQSYSCLWLPDSISSNFINISLPGQYTLIVKDTNNCQRSRTFTAIADSFALTATLGPDRKICQGDYIGLTQGQQQAVNYLWSDGSGNSLITITDTVGTGVSYWVSVTNSNGCLARDTILLTINGVKPIADFISDSVCFGDHSHLTSLSYVQPPFQIVDYKWNLEPGIFSTIDNPSHIFSSDGLNPVLLTISTDSGCVNSVQKNILVYSQPSVNFMPYQGCSGVPIQFDDLTNCTYGNLQFWNWCFNDANNPGADTSTAENPQYQFDSAGTYVVKLITSSEAGCTDSAKKTIMIKKSPEIDFNFTTTCAGQRVFFNNTILHQPWESIIYYHWDFGDGNFSSISNPQHIFDIDGIYQTMLKVKVTSGCEVSKTKTLDVGGVPIADFIYQKNCILNPTLFSDNSIVTNGTINQWHWNFAGLYQSTSSSPSFIFPNTGNYQVTLKVRSDHNCEDSVTLPVQIETAPVAKFLVSPEYGIPPLAVNFTNQTLGAISYHWNFGDGNTSSDENPINVFQNQGIYDVVLTALNNLGCMDSISSKVYVLPTTVDIAITDVKTQLVNNKLYVTAHFVNQGTRKLENIDLSVSFPDGFVLHENWSGLLNESESFDYTFSFGYEINNSASPDYVCVNVDLPGLQDENLENNSFCYSMTDDFLIFNCYPNPASDRITIPFIIPLQSSVKIVVYDEMGKQVTDEKIIPGFEGYNTANFDISSLNSGLYMISISFRDKMLRKKFCKL